jgi:hypothetical protein
MNGVSAQKLQQLLVHASEMVKSASVALAEKDQLIEEYRRRDEASKIASAMKEKNIVPTWALSDDDAVGHIMQMDSEKIAAVKMAVDMAAPQDPFAHLDNSRGDEGMSGHTKGASVFEQFIMGNV